MGTFRLHETQPLCGMRFCDRRKIDTIFCRSHRIIINCQVASRSWSAGIEKIPLVLNAWCHDIIYPSRGQRVRFESTAHNPDQSGRLLRVKNTSLWKDQETHPPRHQKFHRTCHLECAHDQVRGAKLGVGIPRGSLPFRSNISRCFLRKSRRFPHR